MGKARTDLGPTTVLLTGDTHWSDNSRDLYRHEFVDSILRCIKEREITVVLILGDLTEQKDEHRAGLVNDVVDHIARIARLCPVIIIKGNHDYLDDPDVPFFAFVGRLPGVTWINTPTDAKDIPNAPLAGLGRTLLLPHTSNYKTEWDRFDLPSYDYIFTHMTFAGARGENGIELKGIPTEIFGPRNKKRPFVYSGDIHVPQNLGPVTYVGAPYTIDFGDKFHPRMLMLEDGAEWSIECEGPQKRLVTVDELSELSREKGINKGDILKVRVGITADEHAKWAEIQEEVRAWGRKKGVVIYAVQPMVLDTGKKTSAKRLVRARREDGELLKEYARQRGRGEQTVRTGLNLLEKP